MEGGSGANLGRPKHTNAGQYRLVQANTLEAQRHPSDKQSTFGASHLTFLFLTNASAACMYESSICVKRVEGCAESTAR